MVETRPATGQIARFGVFELDLRTGELRKSGLRVGLQDQPLQVLTMLLASRGELVTREELRQRLWPADTFVDFEQGLNAAVKRLRGVLGDSADVPRFIETLPRRGYRWISVEAEREAAAVADTVEGVRPSGRSPLAARWLWLASGFLVSGAAAFGWWRLSPRASQPVSGLRATVLMQLNGANLNPALSPDGRRVAFCGEADGEPGLYVKDIGGGGQVRLAAGLGGVFSPAWSPDGREVAFLRHPLGGGRADEIVVVPAAGGSARRLAMVISSNHGLDWSPDGRLLAFVDKVTPEGPDAIHLLTIATGDRRRLTTPAEASSPEVGDHGPTFSPDGRSVAFIRRSSVGPTSTAVYVHEIGSNGSRAVTSGYGLRDVSWSADGRALLFVVGGMRQGSLWTVDVAGGQARRVYDDGNVTTVSLARGSGTLALERRVAESRLWRASGPTSVRKEPPRALSGGRRHEVHPDYSPDGRRIAMATKEGRACLGVWMCAEDGTDCVEFESEDCLARPQWSPDGRSLATVGWQGDRPLDIYRLEVEGRFVRRLTTDGAVDTVPSWSRDGRWLYFASDRSGAYEIWRMPSAGGDAVQLTRGGGGRAFESEDGRWVYFTNGLPFASVWRMPAAGGNATLVLDKPIQAAKWVLWRDRVLYMDEPGTGGHQVVMFDPATQRSTPLASLERPSGLGLAVSPDGAWILYAQVDRVTNDILRLEGLER